MDALVQLLLMGASIYLVPVITIAGVAFLIGGTPWAGKVFRSLLIQPLLWLVKGVGRLFWRILTASLLWLMPSWKR